MNGFEQYYRAFSEDFLPSSPRGYERMVELTELVGEYLNLGDGALVLDIGCGAGISTMALINNDYRAVGIDSCEFLVEEGKKFFAENQIPAQILLADARKIPFEDAHFDAATMLANPFPHWSMEDFYAIARETFRVLKPGGTLMIDFADFVQLKFSGGWRNTHINFAGGAVISADHRFDSARGTLSRRFADARTGRGFSLDFHIWSEYMIKFILNLAGFEVEFWRADADFPRKVGIATKKGGNL